MALACVLWGPPGETPLCSLTLRAKDQKAGLQPRIPPHRKPPTPGPFPSERRLIKAPALDICTHSCPADRAVRLGVG